MREAQHLAAVEVIEDAIVLSVMRFADELVDVEPVRLPGQPRASAKPELEMAKALVNSLAAEWDPSKYTDQYPRKPDADHQGQDEGQEGRRSKPTQSRARPKSSI